MKSAQKESLAVELHNGEVLHLGVANLTFPCLLSWSGHTEDSQQCITFLTQTTNSSIVCPNEIPKVEAERRI